MSSTLALMVSAEALGGHFIVESGRLKLRSPRTLPPELVGELRHRQADVKAELARRRQQEITLAWACAYLERDFSSIPLKMPNGDIMSGDQVVSHVRHQLIVLARVLLSHDNTADSAQLKQDALADLAGMRDAVAGQDQSEGRGVNPE